MSRRQMFLPTILLDSSSDVPLHVQLRAQIARALGRAPRGARLPSTRSLASLLHVSRNTVLAAYDELMADGLITGERGAGMTIVDDRAQATLFDLRAALREAQFPRTIVEVRDPDGTPLHLTTC